MKTCASCGKANNPTRKYCLRCGKPLYPEKETKQPSAPPIATNEQKLDRAAKQLEEVTAPVGSAPSTPPKATTDDKWVKPSEVSRDRVRTTSPTTGKSEMEKAREAFARAEQVGIADENGEIVETRMLRASEVQELMEGISRQQEVSTAATHPSPEPPQPTQKATMPTPPGKPPGIATSQSQGAPGAPAPTTPKVKAAEIPGVSPPGEPKMAAPPVQNTPIAQSPRPPVMEQVPKSQPSVNAVASSQLKAPIPELNQIISEISDPDFLQDQTIRETVNDLTNLYKEVKHYETDLRSTNDRLEKDAKECWNKAEVKRIQFESLEEQLRLAKQEWTDASKVYQNADKRRKDEVSSREKHIKDLEKKIGKTEDSIRKRIKDLEKEKEKAEQL